jgi:sugar phosphate isomerase/epimerase
MDIKVLFSLTTIIHNLSVFVLALLIPMTTRRTFIKQAGLFTSALLISPSYFTKQKYKLGLQLYTIRDAMAADLKGTLQKVSSFGYEEVEIYGFADKLYYGLEPKVFKQMLDDNNLTTSSGHYNLNKFMLEGTDDDLKRYVDECIEGAQILKQEYIVWPWLDPDSRTIDKFKIVAAKLNLIGERVKAANLLLAYHNHDFEFIDHDGKIGYDVILNETDASLVKIQMDLYWLSHSSKLPAHHYFEKYPGRFVSWHIKDMNKQDRDLHEVVGDGVIDFTVFLKDAKLAGVKHMFVEQGNNYTPDAMQNVAKSARYVKNVLFK